MSVATGLQITIAPGGRMRALYDSQDGSRYQREPKMPLRIKMRRGISAVQSPQWSNGASWKVDLSGSDLPADFSISIILGVNVQLLLVVSG
jgi:hypothetical protein